MAILDYINPGSMMPQTQYKPMGFLAGALYGNQMNDYRNSIEAQQFGQQQSALQKLAEMDTYQKDAPVRAAQRNANIATANATTNTIGDIKTGEASDAQYKTRTLEARIKEAMSKMDFDKNNRAREELLQNTDIMGQISNQIMSMPWQGPGSEMARKQVWDQYRQQYPQLGLPEWSEDNLMNLQRAHRAFADNIQQMRAMESVDKVTRRTLDQEQMQQEGANYRAGVAANATIEAARARGDRPDNTNMNELYAQAMTRLMGNKPNPGDQEVVSNYVLEQQAKDPAIKAKSEFAMMGPKYQNDYIYTRYTDFERRTNGKVPNPFKEALPHPQSPEDAAKNYKGQWIVRPDGQVIKVKAN